MKVTFCKRITQIKKLYSILPYKDTNKTALHFWEPSYLQRDNLPEKLREQQQVVHNFVFTDKGVCLLAEVRRSTEGKHSLKNHQK